MTPGGWRRGIPSRVPALLLSLLLLGAGQASGQDLVAPTGFVTLRGGLLFTEHTTLARVDSRELGAGTEVSVEDDLGLPGSTRDFRGDVALHLGRRHQLRAGYVALSRGGEVNLSRRIQFGDAVFSVDVPVRSEVDVRLIPITYRFAPLRTDRVDVGISAGVFALSLDAEVTAPVAEVEERASEDFPLPVVGIDGVFGLARGVLLAGGFKYFSLEIDGIEGAWTETRAAIEVYPIPRLGLGAGYRFIRLEADGTGDGAGSLARSAAGSLLFLDYEFSGPHVYLIIGI